MKYKNRLIGYEVHAFDKDGNIYVRDRFRFQVGGILCNNPYTIIKEDYATIYDRVGRGQKITLAKINLNGGAIMINIEPITHKCP